MKKFEQPMLSVKVFNRESILTASGTEPKTAAENASDKLVSSGVSVSNINVVKW